MSKDKFLIGFAIILLGLLLNKWVIEKFVPDGTIESLSYIIQILVVQFLLILYGVYFIINKTILKRAVITLLIPFLALSIINGANFLNNKKNNNSKYGQSQAQTMLDRVIFFRRE